MNTFLLIVHGLVAVALLGAVTHQATAALRGHGPGGASFVRRYVAVNQRTFTRAVVCLFVATLMLGAIIYPYYRLNVRIDFEDMGLARAVGLFELKEHFAGIALGVLPLYALAWRSELADTHRPLRVAIALLLVFVVWWNFIVGHVLNNIRGFA
jgi:hypothetical protein